MDAANPKSKIENRKLPSRLRPPQFGLRTLLLVVTACGVLLGLERWFSLAPIAVAAIVLLALSIFCHVAGNVIGTRLREIGDRPNDDPSAQGAGRFIHPQPHQFAPATELSRRQSLGWSTVAATMGGAALAAVGGGLWTWLTRNGPIGPLNVVVGTIAFGVLGGIAAFAIVGLTQVLLGAVWQALNSSHSDSQPPSPVGQSTSLSYSHSALCDPHFSTTGTPQRAFPTAPIPESRSLNPEP